MAIWWIFNQKATSAINTHYRVREHFLDKTGQGAVRLRNHACDRTMTHSKDKRLPFIFSCRGSPFIFACFRLISFKNVKWPRPVSCGVLPSRGPQSPRISVPSWKKLVLDRLCIILPRNGRKETKKKEKTETPAQQSHSSDGAPHG